MKKLYVKPESEINLIEVEDITTSSIVTKDESQLNFEEVNLFSDLL